MGILPLEFLQGQNFDNLNLKERDTYSLNLSQGDLKVGQEIDVTASSGKKFKAKVRIDTNPELQYFKNGGILPYVLRKLMKE